MSSTCSSGSHGPCNSVPLEEIAEIDEFLDPLCWSTSELDQKSEQGSPTKKSPRQAHRPIRRFDSCEYFMDNEANQYLALNKA